MRDVTVVLLDDGLTSTAIMPVEIFHSAGRLWNALHDAPGEQMQGGVLEFAGALAGS